MKRFSAVFLVFVMLLTFAPVVGAEEAATERAFQFSYYKEEDFRLEFQGESLELIDLPETVNFSMFSVRIVDNNGVARKEVFLEPVDGRAVVSMDGLDKSKSYYFELYTLGMNIHYWSYVYGQELEIRHDGDGWGFVQSRVLAENKRIFNSSRMDREAQEYYLRPSQDIQSGDPRIIAKAKEVVGTRKSMDAALALYDYVTNSGYYDWSGKVGAVDAVSTLDTMVGVCENFANLYVALCRAAGLPAKVVNGSDVRGVGHSWAEVFVNSMWIIVDPTFGLTGNYQNGVKSRTETQNYRYFDSTIEAFSLDHRYVKYDESMIPPVKSRTAVVLPLAGKLVIDGKIIDNIEVLGIEGRSDAMLRSFAAALKGTGKEFSVDWDRGRYAILIKTGEEYVLTGVEGTAVVANGSKNATTALSTLFKDDRRIYMEWWGIDGSSYFQIRDLCELLDIYITWDESLRVIWIDTTRGYELE